MSTYYHECPFCGANLDPGEKCDCLEHVRKITKHHFKTYALLTNQIEGGFINEIDHQGAAFINQ